MRKREFCEGDNRSEDGFRRGGAILDFGELVLRFERWLPLPCDERPDEGGEDDGDDADFG